MGINYLPMAENALSSLEYWLNNILLARLKPFYPVILTKFDDYLQMNKLNSINMNDLDAQEKLILFKLSSKSKRSGRNKTLASLTPAKNFVAADELYEQIQFRILKILGQLAGEMSHCLYDENNSNNAGQLVAWDTNLHLKFYVPFVDLKPAIYLDR